MRSFHRLLLTASAAIALAGVLTPPPCHATPVNSPTVTPEGTSWLMLSSGAAPLGAVWLLRHRRKNRSN